MENTRHKHLPLAKKASCEPLWLKPLACSVQQTQGTFYGLPDNKIKLCSQIKTQTIFTFSCPQIKYRQLGLSWIPIIAETRDPKSPTLPWVWFPLCTWGGGTACVTFQGCGSLQHEGRWGWEVILSVTDFIIAPSKRKVGSCHVAMCWEEIMQEPFIFTLSEARQGRALLCSAWDPHTRNSPGCSTFQH